MNKDQISTIADLYPDLTPEEQEEAVRNLEQYLDVVRQITNRLETEGRLDEIEELRLRHEWMKRHGLDHD